MWKDESKLGRLIRLRELVLNLNYFPEIIGSDNVEQDPETELERIYCKFLWQIDETIREQFKKDRVK